MDSTLAAMLFGGVLAGAVLLFFAMSRKPMNCPSCGRELPKIRKPANMEQAMWGGYICEGCGAELDARGKLKAKK
jgi:predicted amidophosphoribosyltransferase